MEIQVFDRDIPIKSNLPKAGDFPKGFWEVEIAVYNIARKTYLVSRRFCTKWFMLLENI